MRNRFNERVSAYDPVALERQRRAVRAEALTEKIFPRRRYKQRISAYDLVALAQQRQLIQTRQEIKQRIFRMLGGI